MVCATGGPNPCNTESSVGTLNKKLESCLYSLSTGLFGYFYLDYDLL